MQGAEGYQSSSGGEGCPPWLGRHGHVSLRSLVWSAWSTEVNTPSLCLIAGGEGDVTPGFFLSPPDQ